ncbi:MAG: AAA family ATPase [Bacteroidales bacterium]|nr:AAA family ATPase [Bacteroidales bacterium]
MKEFKVHITELGPIKDAVIQLSPLMIFTGKSSLGKSYVNFLSYYVFDLFGNNGLYRFLESKIEGKNFKDHTFSFGFKIDEMRQWMSEDVRQFMRELLAYKDLVCDIDFQFGNDTDNDIKVLVKDFGALNPVRDRESFNQEVVDNSYRQISIRITSNEPSIWPREVSAITLDSNLSFTISRSVSQLLSYKLLGKLFMYAFLLPPGRTSLINNSFSVKKVVSNTGMYDRFLHDYDSLQNQNFRFNHQKEDNQFFISQIKRLIHGDVVTEKEEQYLLLDNGQKIPLSAAASSIRELSPLLFWIKNKNIEMSSVCIEEPEAHAHPEMQHGIADLLASCLNKGAFLQITTHSDFFLTRINQLIRLYKFQQNHPDEFENSEFKRNKRQLINPQDVKAYYFALSESTGHVIIQEQQLEDGIPFDSFRDPITLHFEFDNKLNQLIRDDDK